MTCVHLKQLYELCEENHVRLSARDLVHIVCHQCGEQEVCPSMLTDEYNARQSEKDHEPTSADE